MDLWRRRSGIQIDSDIGEGIASDQERAGECLTSTLCGDGGIVWEEAIGVGRRHCEYRSVLGKIRHIGCAESDLNGCAIGRAVGPQRDDVSGKNAVGVGKLGKGIEHIVRVCAEV